MKAMYKLPIIVILFGFFGFFAGAYFSVAWFAGIVFTIASATGCIAYLLEKKGNHP